MDYPSQIYRATVNKLLISNGSSNGIIKVQSIDKLFLGQNVIVGSNSQSPIFGVIIGIIDYQTLIIGDYSSKKPLNLSNYLVSDQAFVRGLETIKPNIKPDDIWQNIYLHDPISGIKVINVDSTGRPYSLDNPLPVSLQSGNIQIDQVNADLNVQLSHLDNYPAAGDVADSVRIGDGYRTVTGTATVAAINKYGLDVMPLNSLIRREFNNIEIIARNDFGDPTTIVYRSNSQLVATVNITYTIDGDVQSINVVYS